MIHKLYLRDFIGLLERSLAPVCIKKAYQSDSLIQEHYISEQLSIYFYRFFPEKYIFLGAAIVYLILPT